MCKELLGVPGTPHERDAVEAPIVVGWCLIFLVFVPVNAARDRTRLSVYSPDRRELP